MFDRGRKVLVRACAIACLASLALGPYEEEAAAARATASFSGLAVISPQRYRAKAGNVYRLIPRTAAPRREVPAFQTEPPLTPLPRPLMAALDSPIGPYATLRTEVRVRFDSTVSHFQAESQFQIEPQIDGKLDWADDQTLRFKPNRLAFDTTYTVHAGAGGRSAWSWQFTTIKPFTITIDDCASTAGELQNMLNVLAQRHITAIMFPTGICQRKYPWLVPAMLAAGHKVCNHTYSHPHLTSLSDLGIASEIRGGVHAGCDLLRPPYGDWDGPDGRVARIAASQGYRIFLWDVDTYDWGGVSTSDILDRIYSRGGVILLHFHGRGTVEALRRLDLQTT